MPRLRNELAPKTRADYLAAMERIKRVTGVTTQAQLAAELGVWQGSISESKRRGTIPAEWLLKLLRTHKVLPDWILTGQGPATLQGVHPPAPTPLDDELKTLTDKVDAAMAAITDALRAARMTADEFRQLKAGSVLELEQARATIQALRGQVRDLSADLKASNFTM